MSGNAKRTDSPDLPDLWDITMLELQGKASASIVEHVRSHLENMRKRKLGDSAVVDCCLLRLHKDMTMMDLLVLCYMTNEGIVLQEPAPQVDADGSDEDDGDLDGRDPEQAKRIHDKELSDFEKMLGSIELSPVHSHASDDTNDTDDTRAHAHAQTSYNEVV
jgi:hypothetical protein